MPPHCIAYTPDQEQSGQHNTNQASPETEISSWAILLSTLSRQADTAANRGRGVGVTAHSHNFILPLPAQPLTAVLTETVAETLRAGKHTQPKGKNKHAYNTHKHTQDPVGADAKALAAHCDSLSGCQMSVVNWVDRNKHISDNKLWQCLPLDLTWAVWRSAWWWRRLTEFT